MARAELQTPEDVFFAVKAAVGPVRSCVFEALALMMASEDNKLSEESAEQIGILLDTLVGAKDMLSKGTEAHFASIGRSVPADLRREMSTTLKSVQHAMDKLKASMTGLEKGTDLSDEFKALLNFTQNTLRPDIDTFLKGLTSHFEEETKRSAADDRDLIKSAMQEIDNISMSINLISLNASVEAARAGEAGRGFAVIAAEIQSLSSDSKKAVDSIRQRLT